MVNLKYFNFFLAFCEYNRLTSRSTILVFIFIKEMHTITLTIMELILLTIHIFPFLKYHEPLSFGFLNGQKRKSHLQSGYHFRFDWLRTYIGWSYNLVRKYFRHTWWLAYVDKSLEVLCKEDCFNALFIYQWQAGIYFLATKCSFLIFSL